MAHQVLVVFGGGYNDDALACSMLGMAAHFRHDPSAVVTSWSNLDLITFVLEGKEMIFGRKEGFGGCRIVLTQYTQDNQERNYQVVPEGDMKRMLLGWVAEKATLPTPFNTMTIVLCAHGANSLTYKHRGVVLAARAVLLGWTPQLSKIEPDELLSQFSRVPPSVQINLISVAHEQSVLEPCSSRACSSDSSIRSLPGSSTLEHNRVIPREFPRDFHVIFT